MTKFERTTLILLSIVFVSLFSFSLFLHSGHSVEVTVVSAESSHDS